MGVLLVYLSHGLYRTRFGLRTVEILNFNIAPMNCITAIVIRIPSSLLSDFHFRTRFRFQVPLNLEPEPFAFWSPSHSSSLIVTAQGLKCIKRGIEH